MSENPSPSTDPEEVQKFSRIAGEWWDPQGKFAALHRFNPVRLAFIRSFCARHFTRDENQVRCFEDLTLLDLGCGGGLLSEPMARLGFSVMGADPSERNVEVARTHARLSGLQIDYRPTDAETLAVEQKRFDVVLCMETVEHVADLRAFLRTTARLVRPGGLMFVATLNKTLKSFALGKVAAEYLLGWIPVGTHDWARFVEPSSLKRMLEESGLNPLHTQGVSFDPLRWQWGLSNDLDVNYIVVAGH
ncbi:MAG: bifunctional 2-polyprenyl-6-hydroxyphenol methylase/3-demethylubiquinol 3-O-methyltransferase UbiG [Alphaproteobacteria bacterium]|nr:bifunctional 2-polyprenyl-6-hydroxyphenol methylase/3-demethylubiquinol 3-O-methyltransferase UbiG [Alphaproteobacteria bacterium]